MFCTKILWFVLRILSNWRLRRVPSLLSGQMVGWWRGVMRVLAVMPAVRLPPGGMETENGWLMEAFTHRLLFYTQMLSRVTVLRLRKNTWPQYQNPDPVLLWGWCGHCNNAFFKAGFEMAEMRWEPAEIYKDQRRWHNAGIETLDLCEALICFILKLHRGNVVNQMWFWVALRLSDALRGCREKTPKPNLQKGGQFQPYVILILIWSDRPAALRTMRIG